MPAAGGVPVAVTKPAAGEDHTAPQFLPDGRHFLYRVIGSKGESSGIYVSSLVEGAQPVRLLPDTSSPAKYTPPADSGGSGHLLFVRETTLVAQPFEPETLRLTGEVFPLAEPVTQFSVSESGAFAYISGATTARQELVWLDRSGKPIESAGPPGDYGAFRLSPDEKSIVFNRSEAGNLDIWVLDMTRSVPSRDQLRSRRRQPAHLVARRASHPLAFPSQRRALRSVHQGCDGCGRGRAVHQDGHALRLGHGLVTRWNVCSLSEAEREAGRGSLDRTAVPGTIRRAETGSVLTVAVHRSEWRIFSRWALDRV